MPLLHPGILDFPGSPFRIFDAEADPQDDQVFERLGLSLLAASLDGEPLELLRLDQPQLAGLLFRDAPINLMRPPAIRARRRGLMDGETVRALADRDSLAVLGRLSVFPGLAAFEGPFPIFGRMSVADRVAGVIQDQRAGLSGGRSERASALL